MSATALYSPPTPTLRGEQIIGRPFPFGLMTYFSALSRNPLETWGPNAFRLPIIDFKFLGRRFVILNEPDAIRHCFVTEAQKYRLNYLRIRLLEPLLRNGLIIAEGELWRRTRRALTPVFTPRHVAGFAPAMRAVAEERRIAIAAKSGAPFSMAAEMLDLALDELMACLFSPEDRFDRRRFSQSITALLDLAGTPHPLDVIRAPDFVPRFGRGPAQAHIESLRAQVSALVADRRRRGPARQHTDFLALLLNAGADEGSPLDDDTIIDNLLTFIAAGHETTARSLAWTLFLLSAAPEIADSIVEEIRAAPLDETPPDQWAERLPLLEATIKESLRLYPPAAHLARVAVEPDRIGDIDVAPGTEVHMSPWLLHRQENLWRDPGAFDPSRFLGRDEGARRFTFLPFGVGPRVCIGARFSMQEMIIVLATLLPTWRFDHVGASAPIPVLRVTLQPSTPLMMKAIAR